jgi:putative ABC transport system permease protein
MKGANMETILSELQTVSILSSQQMLTLQNYIKTKYIDLTKAERAKIFARAVHQICDKKLIGFDEDQLSDIKKQLIKNVLTKEDYSITGTDLLKACQTLEHKTYDLTHGFYTWLKHHQKDVSHSEITTLLGSTQNGVETQFEVLDSNIHIEDSKKAFLPFGLQAYLEENTKLLQIGAVALLASILIITPIINKSIRALIDGQALANVVVEEEFHLATATKVDNGLPTSIQYKPFNLVDLKSYLLAKNSLLAEEPYFSAIIDAGREFDVNPLLLFAIAGQEQSFVPKDHELAKEMANNPFNVFYSWKKYNTDIEDTSRIAARTLVNLGQGCPDNINPIKWINRKYASDPGWWKGVNYLLEDLEKNVI